ncbi:hypothetical protein E5676_scaffold37G00090 [Cucumis melo var. makuwa]|uniref:CACTA en-spm transposon protein n=1 Tax=Cucumis melo var. makuwa TaxID=1194695 RepID=A0A5D3BG89_CUCMM|nr:hypothetical protein E6C27_scaffold21G003260 [Cucumis melo var. makuwa]TYJ97651.1 hypothetical protein E5676_scaffold37G00090 [Cucumis melo var. makuwa]
MYLQSTLRSSRTGCSTWKEFRGENHRYFKQFNNPEEVLANPLMRLEQLRVNKIARVQQPYDRKSEFPAHPKDSQSLFGDDICEIFFGRRSGYLKGLGWGPKPKSRKSTTSSYSSSYHEMRSREISKLKASLENANCIIEEQRIREEEHD